ncbi:formimidoylglutamate deiminase [Janthinobacterium agaricidamnosum]|uniref:Formiminoglutamate deiminase n=1 Tax=Janthinobacterium agaricidamnosum NBRC 102515 = DSM 9628 TaxID=1349767 RepID=W0UXI5_9BURK|nr:formimidoylglutamate deiminase [Janthinobacterium agaricidamnosum]CDG81264.1 formiminoglutamate deiminase [Janthinobacterium agaricidamnosum NBRC 102515 = DSM 9628]
MTALFARHALLPDGWASDVLLEWNRQGDLTGVSAGAVAPAAVEQAEYVLPGMINLHSHAFQRALGGLTEKAGDSPDSFWTWRDLMYRFARNITPDHIEAIAAQLFSECLRHGYTAVCEFHYVQRDPHGALYANPAETAERVIAASRLSGIGITMLPVLYSYSGFGETPLKPEQARFRTDVADLLSIVEALEPLRDGQTEVGVAPHSLRAASAAHINQLLAALPAERPVHIHIAEQQQEVAQSVNWSGRRPVQWLLEQVKVDARWCLVHATHLLPDEVAALAASGAVAGLCPTTEANLGDGLFPLADFIHAGGRFGIGSDSHISQGAVEELRWLEYGQRLHQQRRNVASSGKIRNVGDFLWRGALQGGAQASGRRLGALAVGKRADLIVLDADHPNLHGVAIDDVLGSFIFCGNDNLVADVLAGGQWLVRGQRHVAQQAITARYKATLAQLRKF